MSAEPDQTLAGRLADISAKATDENLTDNGRYFSEFYQNLTSCGHGDTGEFGNKADGKLIETMWNAHRSGQLITLAEAQAMVAAAWEAAAVICDKWHALAMERVEANPDNESHEFTAGTAGSLAFAIRAAATATKEGE